MVDFQPRHGFVPESAVKECIYQAEQLLTDFKKWLTMKQSELLD